MKLRVASITAAVVLSTAAAHAQLVVGSDQTAPATIWHIDVATSAATALYTGGTDAQCWGMAYDPATNNLFWNNGSTLYSSPFSMGGLLPTLLGTMTYNGNTVNFVGLGFRNGKLLGTRNISVEAVYEIDPISLVATQLYVYPSTYDFGGVDVDAATTLLYGLNDATGGGGRGLYEVDVGAATVTLRAPYPPGETDLDGLAVHNGTAYYVSDQPGTFYLYDVASGTQTGTLTSPFTASAVFSAAAYVPGGPVSIEAQSWGSVKNQFR